MVRPRFQLHIKGGSQQEPRVPLIVYRMITGFGKTLLELDGAFVKLHTQGPRPACHSVELEQLRVQAIPVKCQSDEHDRFEVTVVQKKSVHDVGLFIASESFHAGPVFEVENQTGYLAT